MSAILGAVLNAVSSVANTVGNNIGLEKKTYLQRLQSQSGPGVKDWFAQNKTDFTGRNNIIIIVLVASISMILIVLAFKK